jgi:hypothetical protein
MGKGWPRRCSGNCPTCVGGGMRVAASTHTSSHMCLSTDGYSHGIEHGGGMVLHLGRSFANVCCQLQQPTTLLLPDWIVLTPTMSTTCTAKPDVITRQAVGMQAEIEGLTRECRGCQWMARGGPPCTARRALGRRPPLSSAAAGRSLHCWRPPSAAA